MSLINNSMLGVSMINKSLMSVVDGISAPVFTLQPQSQTVDEYGLATFSCEVAGGVAPYSYQWKKNAVNVGTNSAALSFTAADADSNALITVVVTDSVGNVITSDAALLGVTGLPYFDEIIYGEEEWTYGVVAPDGSKAQYGLLAGNYSSVVDGNADYYVKVEWSGVTGKFSCKLADTFVVSTDTLSNSSGYVEKVIEVGTGTTLWIQDAVGGTTGGTITVSCKKVTYPSSFYAPMVYDDYASLNSKFESDYPVNKPYMTSTNANDADEYAWHCVYWLQFYIEMHRLSGDVKWYTYMTNLISRMFDYTDEARQSRGEIDTSTQLYTQAPTQYMFTNVGVAAPAWRRNLTSYEVIVLITGQICRGIMKAVDYILVKNNHSASVSLANSYIPKIRTALNIHDDTWRYDRQGNGSIPGSFHYQNPNIPNGTYSNPVANNHNFVWATAALLTNKWATPIVEYTNRSQAILNFIRLYWIEKPDNNALVWRYAYDVANPNSKIEDINHGHLDLSFFLTVYKRKFLNMTEDEYNKIANNVVYWYIADQNAAVKIDGTDGVAIQAHQIEIALEYPDLSDKRNDIRRIARGILNKHLTNPSFSTPYAALATIIRVDSLGAS